MRSSIGSSQRYLEGGADVINCLSDVWVRKSPQPLWWDAFAKVFVTAEAHATASLLFGSGLERTLWNACAAVREGLAVRSTRRWYGPTTFSCMLPDDAVVFAKRDSWVIASGASGAVLKVTTGCSKAMLRELEAWEIGKIAGIDNHMPKLLESGEVGDHGRWSLSALVPNTRPLRHRLTGSWLKTLKNQVLPVLEKYYLASGVSEFATNRVLVDEACRTENWPESHPQRRLLELVQSISESCRATPLLEATIHGDLRPRHYHGAGQNWWLIDWGSARKEILREIFRDYLNCQLAGDRHAIPFAAWLRGDLSGRRLPRQLKATVDFVIDWMSRWQHFEFNNDVLRLHLLLIILRDGNNIVQRRDFTHLAAANCGDISLQRHANFSVRRLVRQWRLLGLDA